MPNTRDPPGATLAGRRFGLLMRKPVPATDSPLTVPALAPVFEMNTVAVVVGDGGFQMTMAELATIVQENLKVNIAIINNGYLGMVRQWQEFFYDRNYESTPLLSPNFGKLADAYGIRNITVTKRAA